MGLHARHRGPQLGRLLGQIHPGQHVLRIDASDKLGRAVIALDKRRSQPPKPQTQLEVPATYIHPEIITRPRAVMHHGRRSTLPDWAGRLLKPRARVTS